MRTKQKEEGFDDLEFDDDEVIDDNEEQQNSSTHVEFSIDKKTRKAIVNIINEETSDIRKEQKKMAKQIKLMDSNMSSQAKLLEKLDLNSKQMLRALSRIDSKAVVTTDDVVDAVDSDTSEEKRGVIGTTLGAVGSVAHGVVDTVAFVLESAIDLVTLGNARK